MNKTTYTSAERDLVGDWAEKWLEFFGLVNEVTGTDGPPYSPPMPCELDEIKYQSFRFWFIDHQDRFVPLWKDFRTSVKQSEDYEFENDLRRESPELSRYIENPFFFFYEPENLYRLAQRLELQSGIDIWEPSENAAVYFRTAMLTIGKTLIEFIDWMNERIKQGSKKDS